MREAERFDLFVGTITSIYKSIQHIKKNKIRECGLRGVDVMFLFCLSRAENGLNAVELCRKTGEDKATTSRVLADLSEKGLVAYLPSETRYRARAALTAEGRVITDRIDGMISEAVMEAGRDLTQRDRETMYRALQLVAGRLEEITSREEP